MSGDDFTKPFTTQTPISTTRGNMDGYPGFPMSIIVTGFFVTSLAYLVCFCCCIIQFFIRRSREMRQNSNATTAGSQKNDTLKRRFLKQFRNSLRKLQRSATSDDKELKMVREMSTLGTTSSCPICFDEYTGDPAEILMGKIKSCGHFYHFDCIWTWLEARGNCPLCREKAQLKEEDIQALALRHLLHELNKNTRDHTLVNMTDQLGNNPNGDISNSSSSSGQVAVDVEPGTSAGIVNDGFEDVDLESETESPKPVAFVVGDETVQAGDSQGTDGVSSSKSDNPGTDSSVSKMAQDDSEVVVQSSATGHDDTSSNDNKSEQPAEV